MLVGSCVLMPEQTPVTRWSPPRPHCRSNFVQRQRRCELKRTKGTSFSLRTKQDDHLEFKFMITARLQQNDHAWIQVATAQHYTSNMLVDAKPSHPSRMIKVNLEKIMLGPGHQPRKITDMA